MDGNERLLVQLSESVKQLADRVLQLELQLSITQSQLQRQGFPTSVTIEFGDANVRLFPLGAPELHDEDLSESGDLSDEEGPPEGAWLPPITEEDLDRIVNGADEDSDLGPDIGGEG